MARCSVIAPLKSVDGQTYNRARPVPICDKAKLLSNSAAKNSRTAMNSWIQVSEAQVMPLPVFWPLNSVGINASFNNDFLFPLKFSVPLTVPKASV